jgi:hypothetical protein
MPHVDDGTLNALLDGALHADDPAGAAAIEAHLEACDDCRARARVAAGLRDRAASILGAASAHATPDFQEVLVRAGMAAAGSGGAAPGPAREGGTGRLRRHARTPRRLAWAATIIIALGTGYLIRDLVPDGDRVTPAAMADRGAEPGEGAGRRAVSAAETEPPAAAPERAGTAPPAEVAPPVAESPRIADRGRADTAPPPAAEEPAAEQPRAAPHAVERVAVERTTPDVVITGAVTAQQERVATARAVAEPAPPRAPARRMGEQAIALDAIVVTAAWRTVDIAEAQQLAEGTLYVLPGAAILEVEVHAQDGASAIRSTQRLHDGAEVTVTQTPTDDPAPGLPGVPAPRIEGEGDRAVVIVGGFRIEASGPLPGRTLRALLVDARPLESVTRRD